MDIMIIIGLLTMGITFMLGVPELRTDISTYLQAESFILVLGGTLASTIIGSTKKDFLNIATMFKKLLFKSKTLTPRDAVITCINISKLAQTIPKQDLAKEGKNIGDGFLERALSMVGEGLDEAFIRQTLETDMSEVHTRHTALNNMVRTMGSYAPMFGMAGTVLGVTQVLKNVTDINNIVSGMSLALLTTLYGLLLTSIIFIPIANKLKAISTKEILTKQIILEGVMAIMKKEIPLKVEKYLTAFLESQEKDIRAKK